MGYPVAGFVLNAFHQLPLVYLSHNALHQICFKDEKTDIHRRQETSLRSYNQLVVEPGSDSDLCF